MCVTSVYLFHFLLCPYVPHNPSWKLQCGYTLPFTVLWRYEGSYKHLCVCTWPPAADDSWELPEASYSQQHLLQPTVLSSPTLFCRCSGTCGFSLHLSTSTYSADAWVSQHFGQKPARSQVGTWFYGHPTCKWETVSYSKKSCLLSNNARHEDHENTGQHNKQTKKIS